MMKKISSVALAAAAALVMAAAPVTLSMPVFSTAEAAVATKPFGGTITIAKYCCDGIKLTVSGKYGGTYMLSWGTFAAGVFAYYNVFDGSGQYTLGTATPGAVCDTGSYCSQTEDAPGGWINIIGTSA